jgi:hypothetical protein
MALVDLWLNSQPQLTGKHFQQIIAFAGAGKLRDGSTASNELRQFLSIVPSSVLRQYAIECLEGGFPDSGLALQEVVNEVGHRLGFEVEHGRYRGTPGAVGFDGIWALADHRAIIVEVKTTDAYRIDLDVLAGYRRALNSAGKLKEDRSSILIIVGRQDTGDLEAQIRGSRHAWDIRLISVDGLLRLMTLKEEVEDPRTLQKIHNVLFPMEFTKLDEIVNLVFSAAEDLKQEEEQLAAEEEITDEKKFVPVSFHDACIQKIEQVLKTSFVKKSRASYLSSDGKVGVVCAVSKQYERRGERGFWFAFHPHQKDFLSSLQKAYVAFGCGSEKLLLLIPRDTFTPWLDGMNKTTLEDRFYWHVHIYWEDDPITLYRSKGFPKIDLKPFLVG